MLVRLMLSSALALSSAAYAACSISQYDKSTVTVTFGGKECPPSNVTKADFARDLKLAVYAMNSSEARSRSDTRTAAQQKLYNIGDMRHQSKHLAAPRQSAQR